MGGAIVEQSRLINYEPIPWNVSFEDTFTPPDNYNHRGYLVPTGRQTTTSWRTGKILRGLGITDTGPSEPLTEAGLVGYLKESDRYDQYSGEYPNDVGHPFNTVTTRFEGTDYASGYIGDGAAYSGPIFAYANETELDLIDDAPSQAGSATYYGTLAIDLTKPLNPVAGVGYILGQILERSWFPELMSIGKFSSLSQFVQWILDNYVNIEFGILPFKSDLESLIDLIRKSHKTVDQVTKDSGQQIRRRHVFKPETEIISNQDMGLCSVLTPSDADSYTNSVFHRCFGLNSRYPTTKTITRQIHRYFSGCYEYYLPPGNFDSALDKVNAIAGVEVTPSLLWELTPWSWVVDWRFNIGQVLSNYSALSSDNLVLKYGYLMVETTQTTTYTAEGVVVQRGTPYGGSGTETLGNVTTTFSSVRKERFKSTPYGFGVDPSGFTDQQLSILGALGILKGFL
jgi:hypothetical protein